MQRGVMNHGVVIVVWKGDGGGAEPALANAIVRRYRGAIRTVSRSQMTVGAAGWESRTRRNSPLCLEWRSHRRHSRRQARVHLEIGLQNELQMTDINIRIIAKVAWDGGRSTSIVGVM